MRHERTGMWPWLLQRVTALYLAFGLTVHFILLHVFTSRPVALSRVQARLVSKWWLVFDLSLLAAAVYHGLNGVYNIVSDYRPHPGNRALLKWVLILVGIATFLMGLYLLVPLSGRHV